MYFVEDADCCFNPAVLLVLMWHFELRNAGYLYVTETHNHSVTSLRSF